MNIPIKTWRFHGGVHPADGKALSNSVPAQRAPLIDRYTVAVQQNIGAPPKPVAPAPKPAAPAASAEGNAKKEESK